ncbi:54S ribosomal protein yml6, mitochondrial [Coemansia sp. BCRC 34962]|nr:54S ribosomal protein yml6, mitochondrial [Coemansia sp. BCRC 34962]
MPIIDDNTGPSPGIAMVRTDLFDSFGPEWRKERHALTAVKVYVALDDLLSGKAAHMLARSKYSPLVFPSVKTMNIDINGFYKSSWKFDAGSAATTPSLYQQLQAMFPGVQTVQLIKGSCDALNNGTPNCKVEQFVLSLFTKFSGVCATFDLKRDVESMWNAENIYSAVTEIAMFENGYSEKTFKLVHKCAPTLKKLEMYSYTGEDVLSVLTDASGKPVDCEFEQYLLDLYTKYFDMYSALNLKGGWQKGFTNMDSVVTTMKLFFGDYSKQTFQLIHKCAHSLESLVVHNYRGQEAYNIFTDTSDRPVEFTRLWSLKLSMIKNSGTVPRGSNITVLLLSLTHLDIDGSYAFEDDVLFKSTSKTLKHANILADLHTATILEKYNVFKGPNYPTSECKPSESKPSEPSVLRPISSKRRIAPSAGEISALNWPLPQALRAVNPFPETIQAWMMDFETNEPIDILDVQRSVFAAPIRPDIVHRVVTYERNMKRQGTHNTRTRSEVRGSTRKVQPQKGLGMARHGTRRAPQFVGGAKAHGPVPRSHETQIQRKVWLMALRSVLSAKYAQDQLVIVDNMEVGSRKTGNLSRMLLANGWSPLSSTGRSPSIMLMPFMEEAFPSELKKLEIASRNIPGVSIMNPSDAEVYEILRHQFLILDRKALDLLEGILKPM